MILGSMHEQSVGHRGRQLLKTAHSGANVRNHSCSSLEYEICQLTRPSSVAARAFLWRASIAHLGRRTFGDDRLALPLAWWTSPCGLCLPGSAASVCIDISGSDCKNGGDFSVALPCRPCCLNGVWGLGGLWLSLLSARAPN